MVTASVGKWRVIKSSDHVHRKHYSSKKIRMLDIDIICIDSINIYIYRYRMLVYSFQIENI